MYEVVNRDSIYTEGYWGWRREYQIREIGDESALMLMLINIGAVLIIVMTLIMVITLMDMEEILMQEHMKLMHGYIILNILKVRSKIENLILLYYGVFRETSVPHTGRYRGGPSIRPRKIKHIVAMYGNPEYKEFNRGSHKELPDGWWDDWTRSVERNWKSQRKVRHQWQR